MILHKILDKSKIKLNDEQLNLFQRTFIIPDEFEFTVVRVTDGYVCRPDLISLAVYGNTSYTDIICKVNGISNPFELNINTYLICPDSNNISDFYNSDNESKYDLIKDIKKTIIKDIENKSPNMVKENDKNFKVDTNKKIIIY